MNRVSFRIGVIAAAAALLVLAVSTAGVATAAGQSFGKDGTIHACFKAKGKNKGALRVVPTAQGCKKLRGWRPLSWTANNPSGGQAGSQGASGNGGERGPQGAQGSPGPEGKAGVAGQVEKSLIETVQSQRTQIDKLTEQVTDLTGGVLDLEGNVTDLTGGLADLEGTVDDTCAQLTVLTDQTDDILTSVAGISLNTFLKNLGGLLEVPTLPAALGTFECT